MADLSDLIVDILWTLSDYNIIYKFNLERNNLGMRKMFEVNRRNGKARSKRHFINTKLRQSGYREASTPFHPLFKKFTTRLIQSALFARTLTLLFLFV